jgi:hypothetical protein
VFIESAAVFHRLSMFLATIPSPVARWSLLTRCLSDLEQATDVTVQAVTAADILSAPLDRDSLRLIRDYAPLGYQGRTRHNNARW